MMYATVDGGSRLQPPRRHLRAVPSEPSDLSQPTTPVAHPEVDVNELVVSLYEAEYQGLARLAYLLVADQHMAEDLAHESFAKLYEHWSDLTDESKAPAYLRATVTNLAMSSHRRAATAHKHATGADPQNGEKSIPSAENEALGRSNRPDVVAALQQLSPKQRTAVVLKYWLRYTETEIAETVGCSVGSAGTHLHRGHAVLAASLGDHG